MDYEQKYKEALERARSIHKDALINDNSVKAKHCELIFPELKESEDERIRKQIISFLKEFEHDHYRSLDFSSWIAWLEKQGNNVDKVEPKFKVGDWVVNQFGDSWHIDSFDKKNYQVSDGKGNYNYFPISKQDEMRLWAIQDAKEGDVLACNEEILLFKSYSVQQGRISLYCWHNGHTDVFHSKEVVDILLTTRNKVCPATKEQRDILFQKMKEAGY